MSRKRWIRIPIFRTAGRIRRRLPAYTVIGFALFLAYLPTFSGDFLFDDRPLVRDNPYVTKLQPLSSYLAQEDGIADERDMGVFRTGYYRPLMNVTYHLDYRLWGMKAAGFRATNWLFHLLTCLILYELMAMLTKRDVWSLLGALLFALHPVQTESVSMVVSRNNIFSAFFVLIALYGYIRWWERKSAIALACSLIAFIGALFSKEFGVMALPILFLYQRLLARKRDGRREAASYLPFAIITAIYLLLRGQVIAASVAVPEDWGTRLLFAPYLVAYNLRLLVFPYGLHSFHVSYPSSPYTATVLLSLALICLVAVLLYRCRRERLMVFSALSFLVVLLPVLNLAAKASVSLIAMRWLYLPLAFLSLGVVLALGRVPDRRRGLTLACSVLIVLYLGAYAYTLNRNLWHDEDAFLRQEALHFRNELYYGDYAELLFQQGDRRQAERFFDLALQSKTAKARDFINYGALLIETKRPGEAVRILERATGMTMIHAEQADWHTNLGVALTLTGRLEQAHDHLKQAWLLDVQNPVRYRNYAILLVRQGRLVKGASPAEEMRMLRPEGRRAK